MSDIELDCPECDGSIGFEVQLIADGYEENTASHSCHIGGADNCPMTRWTHRQASAEFQELRQAAALEAVMQVGW